MVNYKYKLGVHAFQCRYLWTSGGEQEIVIKIIRAYKRCSSSRRVIYITSSIIQFPNERLIVREMFFFIHFCCPVPRLYKPITRNGNILDPLISNRNYCFHLRLVASRIQSEPLAISSKQSPRDDFHSEPIAITSFTCRGGRK